MIQRFLSRVYIIEKQNNRPQIYQSCQIQLFELGWVQNQHHRTCVSRTPLYSINLSPMPDTWYIVFTTLSWGADTVSWVAIFILIPQSNLIFFCRISEILFYPNPQHEFESTSCTLNKGLFYPIPELLILSTYP